MKIWKFSSSGYVQGSAHSEPRAEEAEIDLDAPCKRFHNQRPSSRSMEAKTSWRLNHRCRRLREDGAQKRLLVNVCILDSIKIP